MGQIIGYFAFPFLLAFCMVHFVLKKRYMKKHGVSMGVASVAGRTMGIGVLLALITLFGAG